MEGIEVVALVLRLPKRLAHIFFSQDTRLKYILEGVGIADGGIERLTEVATVGITRQNAVGISAIAGFLLKTIVVPELQLILSVFKQIFHGRFPLFNSIFTDADERQEEKDSLPVHRINALQFIDRQQAAGTPPIVEQRINLPVGEEGEALELFTRNHIQVERMLGELGEVGVEGFGLFFVLGRFRPLLNIFAPFIHR